jgi:hypothetical protein
MDILAQSYRIQSVGTLFDMLLLGHSNHHHSKYTTFYLKIGYGDIQAHTTQEFSFGILWMLVAVFFYSFAIKNVSLMLVLNNEEYEYDK